MVQRFTFFLATVGSLSLLGWLIVLFRLDPCRVPNETGCEVLSPLAIALFFISLILALIAIFTLLSYFLRRWLQEEYRFDQMTVSLRQGFLLAFLSCGSLVLLIFEVLTWWSGFLFLAFVVLMEMYFLAHQR